VGVERLMMITWSLLDMDEFELESTLSPRRQQYNSLDVLAEVAGNVRESAGRGAQLVDGPATKLAAESKVGAAGVSMPLEADGGRSCRSCRSRRPEMSSVLSAWSPLAYFYHCYHCSTSASQLSSQNNR